MLWATDWTVKEKTSEAEDTKDTDDSDGTKHTEHHYVCWWYLG